MISALHHKKITINLCEDSLTSCIFDILFLLPKQLCWEIVRKAVRATPQNTEQEMPTKVGRLLHYAFWPKWSPKDTQNVNYVEPDVFIRFSEFDVIIEVKRYEEGLQNSTQWEKEIIAYRNEYGHCKKLYFIALGGLCDDKIKQVKKVPIFRCLWSNLLDAADKTLANDECFCSILRLLVGFFEIHGYPQTKWLKDIIKNDNKTSGYKMYVKNSSASIAYLLRNNDFGTWVPFTRLDGLKPVLKNYDTSINILHNFLGE